VSERIEGPAGELALGALGGFGVDTMFTLNGGHVWPLYHAAVKQGVRIIDTRHEQTAAWAAEAWAKLHRSLGLAVLTAGPGVTNGISAITSAHFNGAPLVVLAGRAPQARWGSGSLQELDHVPIVASITKSAATVTDPSDAAKMVAEAATIAATPHRGPVFVDFPLDVIFAAGTAEMPAGAAAGSAGAVPDGAEPDAEEVGRAAALIAAADRPAIIAGSDVYWGGAWEPLRGVVEEFAVPCFANGMGRGCLPGDHPLAFSRTRGLLRTEADLVVVVGTPLDFRLNFGRFGPARVVHLVDSVSERAEHASVEVSVAGDLGAMLDGIAAWSGPRVDHRSWVARLRHAEQAALEAERPQLAAPSDPIKPTRVFGELAARLERDAVIICDGGDFASYAGKYLDSYTPGCWLDTGPYGCLGNGLGYAVAARLARPASQVVAVLGDGAAGFALMDVDTLVRHGLPAVLIVGNNGIWGLEKHPMRAIYGWDAACDLQPGCRYDLVASALGADGELVTDPDQIGPALDRAFASPVPYLVNVVTDPADAYPRSATLA
jgi:acetolactate synthase-1/2/3 large subunit